MIFLTGGTGLVGSYILLLLMQKKTPVLALKRPSSSLKVCEKIFNYYNQKDLFSKIIWCEGDINNIPSLEEHMQKCTTVIHAAGLVSFQKSDLDSLKKVNIEGTANVMNVALSYNYKKCIYISSVSTLGREIENQLINEESFFQSNSSVSNYAYSKFYAEQEVWRASSEGLDVIILNPSIILGPGNWNKGSSKIFKTIYNGLRFYTHGKSGYVDVYDVANIAVDFLNNEIKNEKYILNGKNISFRDAFNKIADEFGVKRATIPVTPFLKEIAWRIDYFKSFFTNNLPLITKETANSSMKKIAYSSEKICKTLDYKFVDFDETISKYCKFFKEDLI